jgi:hypothetical protein
MSTGHRFLADQARAEYLILDPGDANYLDTQYSGVCMLTSGASGETRKVAAPGFVGQRLLIGFDTDGGGDIDITFDVAVNNSGNTIAAFDAVDDYLELVGVQRLGVTEWQIVSNQGSTALS